MRKDGTSLAQLEEDLGLGFIELAVPRLFEEVKTNVFETAPPRWKLDDLQNGWSQEEMKRMIKWKERRKKEEIEDSQMEEEELVQTVNSKKDLEKWLKQEDNNTLKATWRPTTGSLAREVNTKIKEANKAAEGLADCKYMVKELSREEIE